MSPCTLFVFFPLPYRFVMSLHTCIGMGYRHSMLDASLWSMDASTIVTRLTSRSVMGHALPIQVHQHYGLVFRFALTENSCIRRGCHSSEATRRICTQLERHPLVGLCSCVFGEDRVLSSSDKVEQCFSANPVPGLCKPICDCDNCTSDLVLEIFQRIRWLRKNRPFALHGQRDTCCCRSDHVEMMD